MTTIFEEEVTCAMCGTSQRVQEMGSTNAFGAMDLDTRPPEMRRSTMDLWVHECDWCGYVAPELEKSMGEGVDRILASAAYRSELGATGRVRLASRFVCRAMLDQASGDFTTAGWRRLHAAWVCDDAGEMQEARRQRLEAFSLFERARLDGQRMMKGIEGGDELLLADIARRAGEFERALVYCEAGTKTAAVPPFVRRLLEFEQTLVRARDTTCHSVDEVEAPGAPEPEQTPSGTVH